MKTLLYLFFLTSFTTIAQTQRDTLVSQIIYHFPKEKASYEKLKTDIKKLEDLEGKPNPEILYSSLDFMYKQNDLDYFKETLTLLTRNYGFNLTYATGYEIYYDAIIKGALADWFKEMYIKNHSEWLSKNLDKQIDIYRLNRLRYDDQLVHRAILNIQHIHGLTSEQKEELRKIDIQYFDRNLDVLLEISNKINHIPTGNSFALIQNHYGIVETHAMQQPEIIDKAWKSLYPFYKASYLDKDISSIPFKNIDSHMYKYNGKQVFDLLRIESFHESWRNNPDDKEIPLFDAELTKKLRTELGWE